MCCPAATVNVVFVVFWWVRETNSVTHWKLFVYPLTWLSLCLPVNVSGRSGNTSSPSTVKSFTVKSLITILWQYFKVVQSALFHSASHWVTVRIWKEIEHPLKIPAANSFDCFMLFPWIWPQMWEWWIMSKLSSDDVFLMLYFLSMLTVPEPEVYVHRLPKSEPGWPLFRQFIFKISSRVNESESPPETNRMCDSANAKKPQIQTINAILIVVFFSLSPLATHEHEWVCDLAMWVFWIRTQAFINLACYFLFTTLCEENGGKHMACISFYVSLTIKIFWKWPSRVHNGGYLIKGIHSLSSQLWIQVHFSAQYTLLLILLAIYPNSDLIPYWHTVCHSHTQLSLFSYDTAILTKQKNTLGTHRKLSSVPVSVFIR